LNKTTITFIFLLFCSISASAQRYRPAIEDYQAGRVTVLTQGDFIRKIADYRNLPDTFVYIGRKPCIIDFYADWCVPCKLADPLLADLAKKYINEVYFYRIDVEKTPELVKFFNIHSIPLFIFCPIGDKPHFEDGLPPLEEFENLLILMLLNKK
jgi:thiol-disulfide isomerase/thioredoxin